MAGLAIKLYGSPPVTVPIKSEIAAETFCPCDFRCDFEELAFADPAGDDPYKSDLTDFLFRRVSATDTVDIQLFRNGAKVADITDDSYGEFFDGFPNGNAAQQLYVGWIADWTAIFSAFSGGRYQVKAVTNILGVEETFESRFFRVNLYNEKSANRTNRIESVQNGNIISSEFDYTDLNWVSYIRLGGTFGEMTPSLESDVFLDSNYNRLQNRDEVIREYSLNCEMVPERIYTRMATKDVMGNEIYITAYNLLQDETYDRFPVVTESFEQPVYTPYGRVNFVIRFKDRTQNVIKRNF